MGFQTGLSGLNAASRNLDVIGNNVANANTIGYKSSRAEFADVYAASLAGGGSSEIGIGTRMADVAQQFTQGNLTTTDNPLDLAVSGNGFFRLTNNGEVTYTRNGQFKLDNSGNIVNSAGRYLTGYSVDQATGLINPTSIGPLQVQTADITPQASTNMQLTANLDAREPVITGAINPNQPNTFNHTTSTTVYDSLGNSHAASLFFQKSAANTWNVELYVDGAQVALTPPNMSFSTGGALTAPATGQLTSASFTPAGAAAQALTFDMAQVTQFGSSFGVTSQQQDGFASGRLAGFGIDDSGTITGRYTNGEVRKMGQVILSTFPSVTNLQPIGNNEWQPTDASGTPINGVAGTGNLGLVQSQRLEESNVDLTSELVNMITAQRIYQANAQTVRAQDQLLQTIVNLR